MKFVDLFLINCIACQLVSKYRIIYVFCLQLFNGLKETRGTDTILNQCHVIPGDVTQPGLGISDEDRELLAREISMVYHCAATVRFDESLKKAVLLNTRGTKLMLELAKTMTKLDVSLLHEVPFNCSKYNIKTSYPSIVVRLCIHLLLSLERENVAGATVRTAR